MYKIPPIDAFSFWLGFGIACLLWFIISQLKGYFPSIKTWIKRQNEIMRQQRLAGIGAYIRQDTFKRAQKSHLSGSFFSLEEILVPPHLIAPPPYLIRPDGPIMPSSSAGQVIPYLPDWPEISAQYYVEHLTLAQALQKGARIAVSAQPGMGKTTALAHLAIQVARKDPQAGKLADLIPVFFHIQDIDFRLEQKSDPLTVLSDLVSNRVPLYVAPRIPGFFRRLMESGSVLLIIDGLDELSPADLGQAGKYLSNLLTRYSSISICVASSPENLDGLARNGFFVLGLASWHNQDRTKMIRQWCTAWDRYLGIEIRKKTDSQPMDPDLVSNWFIGETTLATPLEWTLKLWATFAGDVCGPSNLDALESYINRTTSGIIPRPALEALACELVRRLASSISFSELEQFFSHYSQPDPSNLDDPTLPGNPAANDVQSQRSKNPRGGELRLSSGARAIHHLLSAGILVEHDNEQISYSHPVIQGYLASGAAEAKTICNLTEAESWPPAILSMRYMAAQNKITAWISTRLIEEDLPLQQGLLLIARWLADAPANADWRSLVMRHLVDLIQNEEVPYPQRVRSLAGILAANDPSVQILFKQLVSSPSAQIRKLAILGAGAIRDARVLDDLLGLLVDPNKDVRIAATLAIGSIATPNAKRALAETLLHGDEELRQAVAEMMAYDPLDGHGILKDALEVNDLLTRRAAIYGLAKIREEWVKPLLEKIAVEDSQWVVRNAASQALEDFKSPQSAIPMPLPAPGETAWLLNFASRQGVSIAKGDPALELIVQSLVTGTHPEKLAALNYFLQNPQTAGIGEIYKLYYQETGPMQEAASFALWQLAASGVPLPNPAQIGLA